MKTPPIGTTVLFYVQGDVKSPPMVAFVQGGDNGVLELATLPKYSTAVVRRGNVRHVDDPMLDEFRDARVRYGAWDTVEAGAERADAERRRQQAAIKRKEDAARKKVEDEQKAEEDGTNEVVRLFQEERLNAVEIAQKMTVETGAKWSHQRVNAILRNKGALVHS